MTTLADLKPGESGIVQEITLQGKTRQRLISMGMTPGTWLIVRKFAPFGDPIEIRLRNYSLSLRKKEAAGIVVSRT